MKRRNARKSRDALAWLSALLLLIGLAAVPVTASAQDATPLDVQIFELRAGWNAIWIEVEPESADCDTVFEGLPVLSVRTWTEPSTRQFHENPREPTRASTDWATYFPPTRPESVLTSLFGVRAGQAYLVEVDDVDGVVSLNIEGRRSLRAPEWTPDSFNLVGFPVDTVFPPSFQTLLSGSDAHARLEAYRLRPEGVWEPVDPACEFVRRGEAYWVFCEGSSTFNGTFEARPQFGRELDFGGRLLEQSLRIQNRADEPSAISLRMLDSGTPVPLSYWRVDLENEHIGWTPLEAPLTWDLTAGGVIYVRLAVRRAELAEEIARTTLEIRDSLGTVQLAPVSVERRVLGVGVPTPVGLWVGSAEVGEVSGIPASGLLAEFYSNGTFSGEPLLERVDQTVSLGVAPDVSTPGSPISVRWSGFLEPQVSAEYSFAVVSMGPVTLRVGPLERSGGSSGNETETTGSLSLEAGQRYPIELTYASADASDVLARLEWSIAGAERRIVPRYALRVGAELARTPTRSSFPLRLLLHVDNAASGSNTRLLEQVIQMRELAEPGEPSELVLLTDDALISQYTGVSLRGGKPVGKRISAIGFAFDPVDGEPVGAAPMNLTGAFGQAGSALEVTLRVSSEHPNHPYGHRFHPDHDNLDAEFAEAREEAFAIERRIRLVFEGCPDGAPPDCGDTVVEGRYEETISGMHRREISVGGTFRLKLASEVPFLNGEVE